MLATIDLVRVGSSIAVALLLCTLRLRIILWADAIYSIVAGSFMVYYAKEALKESLQDKVPVAIDMQHEYLLCTRVALQLMPAFTWILCRNSVDITCRTAITLGRLVMYGGAIIVMAIEHNRFGFFTDFHLLYCLLPCVLWSLVMAVQLVRTGSRVNIHIRTVDINKFLRMDLFVLLLSAMADLIAPAFIGHYVGRPVDSVHAYLHRINGCTFLGLAIIPWIGQRYRYSEDKHTIVLARIMGVLVWYGGVAFGIWQQRVPLVLSTYVFLGQMSLMFLPNLIAMIICQNGPFTAAFWSSQRKVVSINQQGQSQRRP